MSPRLRESLGLNQPNFGKRIRNIALTGGAVASALMAGYAFVTPVIRPFAKVAIVNTLDSTYVFQQSFDKKTLVDSLTHKQEVDSLFRMMKSVSESQQRLESLSGKCLTRSTRACR